VLAPMPRARAETAMAVKLRFLPMTRRAWRRSCVKADTWCSRLQIRESTDVCSGNLRGMDRAGRGRRTAQLRKSRAVSPRNMCGDGRKGRGCPAKDAVPPRYRCRGVRTNAARNHFRGPGFAWGWRLCKCCTWAACRCCNCWVCCWWRCSICCCLCGFGLDRAIFWCS